MRIPRKSLLPLAVERASIPAREAITLNLPYPPSVNNLFFNVPGRGRVPSTEYRAWQASADNTIRQMNKPRINGPVEITMTFQEKDRRRRDIDNLSKAPLDALVRMRVIDADDSSVLRRLTLEWGEVSGVKVDIRPCTDWLQRRNACKKVA